MRTTATACQAWSGESRRVVISVRKRTASSSVRPAVASVQSYRTGSDVTFMAGGGAAALCVAWRSFACAHGRRLANSCGMRWVTHGL